MDNNKFNEDKSILYIIKNYKRAKNKYKLEVLNSNIETLTILKNF